MVFKKFYVENTLIKVLVGTEFKYKICILNMKQYLEAEIFLKKISSISH